MEALVSTPTARNAIQRLRTLADLDAAALSAIEQAAAAAVRLPARAELLAEGEEIKSPLLVLDGWAARVRILTDGRRQLLSLILPGELIGHCAHERPLALSTIAALCPLTVCDAPGDSPALARCYAVSAAFEEAYLLAQITRLGRMSALDRLLDLLLEVRERLALSGNVRSGAFTLPLTQELLADILGLTPVHVNRIVQQARHLGWLEWHARRATIHDPETLAARLGRAPTRVQARG